MALIIRNASFRDTEGLETLIDLYKKGSITDHALSSELTLAARDVMVHFGNNVYIEIVKDSSTNNRNFGIVMLPKATVGSMDIYVFIDEDVFNVFSAKQVLGGITLLLANYNKIAIEFCKFNMKRVDFDVDMVDALTEVLKLYKISLDILYELKDSEAALDSVINPEDIEGAIESLENNYYTEQQAIEFLSVKGYLPDVMLQTAKDIVSNINSLKAAKEKEEKVKSTFDPLKFETPDPNVYWNKARDLSNKTYDLYHIKEIPHDYEPPTNQ